MFDPGKESCYLQYLDSNNLYGWAMVQKLLTGGFIWVENADKLKSNINKLAKQARKGYLLVADVSYPNNLYDLHNDLTFMCEKRKTSGVRKLVPNLYNNKKYVIHITALDQAHKHGLILDKICRVIEFDQSA